MQRVCKPTRSSDETRRARSVAEPSPAPDHFHGGPRMLAQRKQIQKLFGDGAQPPVPVQRRVYEAVVDRQSEAVKMSPEGSILDGKVVRQLGIGDFVRVDDEDKWRSLRGANEAAPTARWLGARRLGTDDVTGMSVYVPDRHLSEANELESRYIGSALALRQRYGAQVSDEVDRICAALGIDRANELASWSPSHVVLYFAWMAKIGENLSTLFPSLQAHVCGLIDRHASEPSQDQLNEDSTEGMQLDRALIEPINQRLKVWAKVLANDGNEVIESLIDGIGGNPKMAVALEGVKSGQFNLLQTIAEYLRLGQRAIEKALAHNDEAWTLELKSTLESVSGCYAAQAQKVEWVQPKKAEEKPIDATLRDWTLRAGDVGSMGLYKGTVEVDSIADLEPGDIVTSIYVNVGLTYRVVSKTKECVVLKAVGQ